MGKLKAGDVLSRETYDLGDGRTYVYDIVLVEKKATHLGGDIVLADGSNVTVTYFGLTHVSVNGYRIVGNRAKLVRRRFANSQKVLVQEWKTVE